MRDPIPAPESLANFVKPLAEKLSLRTLPWHFHEVLLGFFAYHIVLHVLSPALSKRLCPNTYRSFDRRTQLNWDIHWVSMVQALFINAAALYVIAADPQRQEMDWKGRLWSYTPAMGMVQGFAAGYFMWDLQISLQYISISGPSALLHAVGALAVTCIGFRPFGNYYGISFVLYELSTPFLNIHWFCDKMNMTGSNLQFYNGLALLATFFGCRLVWGTYQSILIYSDIYTALTVPSKLDMLGAVVEDSTCVANSSGVGAGGKASCEFGELPVWLVIVYLLGNTALTLLNFYWFSQMVKAVKKRFTSKDDRNQSASASKKGQ